jgi:hypothetical protein
LSETQKLFSPAAIILNVLLAALLRCRLGAARRL